VVAELLLAVELQVLGDGEGDLVLAEQPQFPVVRDGGQAGRDRVHVDRRGLLALEPEQDGLVAAVSLPGQAE